MRTIPAVTLLISVLILAACGESTEPTDNGQATPTSDNGASAAASGPDLRSGEIQFFQCRACHTLGEQEAHLTGPNLWGVIGAKAGIRENYNYSEAILSSGITWDETTLDAFIANPAAVVPGSRMIFRGISDAEKRADLIAYLRSKTTAAEP